MIKPKLFSFLLLLLSLVHSLEGNNFRFHSKHYAQDCSDAQLNFYYPDQNDIFRQRNHSLIGKNYYNWHEEELKDHFRNSPNLQSFIREHYPVNTHWSNRIVFTLLADEKFLNHISRLMESLQMNNILAQDILVACITAKCVKVLSVHSIQSIYYPDIEKHCSERWIKVHYGEYISCRISTTKFKIFYDLLRLQFSVFSIDADVLIRKSPLPKLVSASNEMYIQYDLPGELNFGCFFLASTPRTIDALKEGYEKFVKNKNENDQNLFSALVKKYKIPYELFPVKEYYTLHYLPQCQIHLNSTEMERVVLVHMTCIEGSENKYLFGRELYGSFSTPSYYHPCYKTVTINYKADYTRDQIAGLLRLGFQASKLYGDRRLRIVGWDYNATVRYKGLVSPDSIYREQNISMVESTYWNHVKQFYPYYEVSTHQVRLNATIRTPEAWIARVGYISKADDITIFVQDNTILTDDNYDYFNRYLCNAPRKWQGWFVCARSCN